MRDIIWTIITIWFIWRIIETFKGYSAHKRAKANSARHDNYSQSNTYSSTTQAQSKKAELRSDAGEYVDYEEVK